MGARPTRYAVAATDGRSRIWGRGLCLTGPDYRGTLLTLLLVISIFAAELAVSFPYTLRNYPAVGIPLLVFMIITFVITVWSAYLASTTDPGIIARSTSLPASVIAFPAVRERQICLKGRLVTVKFCDTCRIWRPPRTSHCATCNNCVRRFDHHCPWLGNDVGLRNYRSYFCFVSVASLAQIIAISTSVLTLHWTTQRFRDEFPAESYAASIRRALGHDGTAVNIALITLCFLGLLFTGGLTGFHIYLMCHNVTTAESFKKRSRNSAAPHDDFRGCKAICFLQCTRREQSAVTQGFLGARYPNEAEITALIDKQVADERQALELTGTHTPPEMKMSSATVSLPAIPPRLVDLDTV